MRFDCLLDAIMIYLVGALNFVLLQSPIGYYINCVRLINDCHLTNWYLLVKFIILPLEVFTLLIFAQKIYFKNSNKILGNDDAKTQKDNP